MIRVGGRLRHSPLPYDNNHPVLLPTEHHISKLVTKDGENPLRNPKKVLVSSWKKLNSVNTRTRRCWQIYHPKGWKSSHPPFQRQVSTCLVRFISGMDETRRLKPGEPSLHVPQFVQYIWKSFKTYQLKLSSTRWDGLQPTMDGPASPFQITERHSLAVKESWRSCY